MKKIAVLLTVCCLCLSLVACGNENWGPGNYTFRHVHISDATESYCATVKSWHDNTSGIELHTEEFGSVYLSEGTYQLFEDGEKCPYCRED